MNCPVCENSSMREVNKDGVQIDICPQCKGVWLDRGELDKLMSGVKEIRNDFNEWHQERNNEYDKKNTTNYDRERNNNTPHYKKKKSFLDRMGDIFD